MIILSASTPLESYDTSITLARCDGYYAKFTPTEEAFYAAGPEL